ncbi:MAG TPA: hypothetical protein VN956_05380 [Pyrinomonadaceae bacterium]|nr:hypothetical protein [Pyrinomonadaceae bacterium]
MLNSDFRDILSAFCDEKVEFMLVGAYAVAAHGLPRATGDIDLWIKCSDDNAHRVWRALIEFGAPLATLTKEDFTKPGTVIQLGNVPRRIDILTEITGVDFMIAQADQLIVSIEGLEIPVIGRSHLIDNKRAVGRPQDQADVARLEASEK